MYRLELTTNFASSGNYALLRIGSVVEQNSMQADTAGVNEEPRASSRPDVAKNLERTSAKGGFGATRNVRRNRPTPLQGFVYGQSATRSHSEGAPTLSDETREVPFPDQVVALRCSCAAPVFEQGNRVAARLLGSSVIVSILLIISKITRLRTAWFRLWPVRRRSAQLPCSSGRRDRREGAPSNAGILYAVSTGANRQQNWLHALTH